jgi:DNA-directed RNA polymerase sigma subunit (sigma70/sigma32)
MVELTFEEYSKRRTAEIMQMIDRDLMTMTAVAKYFGISKQRVQQIYVKEKLLPLIEVQKRGKGCLGYSGHREQAKLPRC